MNKIVQKQNEPQFIDLLKAQNVAHSQAKLFNILDYISVASAIILPIVGIFLLQWVQPIVAFGLIWTIVILISEVFRRNKTIQGTKIQEQFDTELYEMNWNNVLCFYL